MDAFELDRLDPEGKRKGASFLEFLRADSMSLGVYRLRAGTADPQSPHSEDEAYFVAGGRASIRVGSEDRRVGPGSIVFVKAGVDHRFHDIVEDLTVLVLFAPPEGSSHHA